MMWHVYHCFNVKNGKHYVGLTKYTPLQRWRGHVKSSRAQSLLLFHKAIRKHGVQSFVVSTLAKCQTEDEACKAERYWVAYFRSNLSSEGYNMTCGGEGSFGTKR